jgi:hypothetical protein
MDFGVREEVKIPISHMDFVFFCNGFWGERRSKNSKTRVLQFHIWTLSFSAMDFGVREVKILILLLSSSSRHLSKICATHLFHVVYLSCNCFTYHAIDLPLKFPKMADEISKV